MRCVFVVMRFSARVELDLPVFIHTISLTGTVADQTNKLKDLLWIIQSRQCGFIVPLQSYRISDKIQ